MKLILTDSLIVLLIFAIAPDDPTFYYWIVGGLVVGMGAFVFGQLYLTDKLTRRVRRKLIFQGLYISCVAGVFVPIVLEMLPRMTSIKITGPVIIAVVGGFIMFGHLVRPLGEKLIGAIIEKYAQKQGWVNPKPKLPDESDDE